MVGGELAKAVALIEGGDLGHVEAARRRVLAFCAAHPDSLHRSCGPGHLTGSGLVVDPADGRFVVLRHRKLDRWLQPGGHADGDGDLASVTLREAREETGLADLTVLPLAVDVDVHQVSPPGEEPHLHLDVRFLVLAPPGIAARGQPPGNDESLAVRWVSGDDLGTLRADDSLRRLAARGLAALPASSVSPGTRAGRRRSTTARGARGRR